MSKKILLADDSITIQKVVELTFSDGDYEVIAVNNGAKAVARLAEMRPDIILSDIIMPEKNGYEVCEFVKSHPEYRTIPVVLLTGTFEPFDPDRADKAGCDAVVTKPFESQSLIRKVEELIDQSRSNAPTAPTPAMSAPSDSTSAAASAAPPLWSEPSPSNSPFSSVPSSPAPAAPPSASAFGEEDDFFGGAPAATPSSDPFGSSSSDAAFSGETRTLPKISFADMPSETPQGAPPAANATDSPWDDQPAPPVGETRAFPRMNLEEMQRLTAPPTPSATPSAEAESPFGASPSAEAFSGETRAFPKMSIEDMKQMASEPPQPAPAQESAPSPWDEPAAYSGETKTFTKINFEEVKASPSGPAASSAPSPWNETPEPSAPAWPAPNMPSPAGAGMESSSQDARGAQAGDGSMKHQEPAWAMEETPAASPGAAPVGAQPAVGGDLTDEQVERIARRVVQMISDQVIRNIAWEVIPDLAEMVVKERIRQLESEA